MCSNIHWITSVCEFRLTWQACLLNSTIHGSQVIAGLSVANCARSLTLVPDFVSSVCGCAKPCRDITLRRWNLEQKSHARDQLFTFKFVGRPWRPDKKRISMIDLSPGHFLHPLTLFSLSLSSSLFFSQYSRTSHRASKISKSLRSECRSRLIVTEAALDRFSNFVMTLKKWPPSRDVDRKRTFAHARERGVLSILNWYHMLTDSDLDWLLTGRFSYALMPRSDNFFYFTWTDD